MVFRIYGYQQNYYFYDASPASSNGEKNGGLDGIFSTHGTTHLVTLWLWLQLRLSGLLHLFLSLT